MLIGWTFVLLLIVAKFNYELLALMEMDVGVSTRDLLCFESSLFAGCYVSIHEQC